MRQVSRWCSALVVFCCAVAVGGAMMVDPGGDDPSLGIGTSLIQQRMQQGEPVEIMFGANKAGAAIEWTVMAVDHESAESAGDGRSALFVVSSAVLGKTGNLVDRDTGVSEGSLWCESFADDAFSESEDEAIARTVGAEAEMGIFVGGGLFGERLFFLSAAESQDSALGFGSDDDRVAVDAATGEPISWWLRSSVAGDELRSWTRNAKGRYGIAYAGMSLGARPAMNIKQDAVAFSGAIEKPSYNEGGQHAYLENVVGSQGRCPLALTLYSEEVPAPTIVSLSEERGSLRLSVTFDDVTAQSPLYVAAIALEQDTGKVAKYGVLGKVPPDGGAIDLRIVIPCSLSEPNLKTFVFTERREPGSSDLVSRMIEVG